MRKRKKTKRVKNARTHMQLLSQEQTNFSKEAEYIIQRAQENDARVVRLGTLVLFSTQSGDAWILDAEDELALCLARSGEKQPYRIIETSTNFAIEWAGNYHIEGERFLVTDPSGQVRTILGYPTREILRALQQAG